MKATAIKTHKITINDNLLDVVDKYVNNLQENSILAITSKIVSLTNQAVIKRQKGVKKVDLVHDHSELYLDPNQNKYNAAITIVNGKLIGSAGIDSTNTDGYFVLWPPNLQEITNQIRDFLRNKFKLKNFGVIITDSTSMPLQMGVIGIGIAYSGFRAFVFKTERDVFNKSKIIIRQNVLGGLSASAVLVMGEGNNQTPLCLLSELDFVNFIDNDPTNQELSNLKVKLENDLFHNVWEKVDWKKGKLYKD
ncbi:MAG: hypothetical protein KatS3mg085_214 [Candidatus Dojkabacteria bacterium]|nr:MAG: hypothetical protein KatS3mg085_214 [Candidatus Dojkabacteria bacterium]